MIYFVTQVVHWGKDMDKRDVTYEWVRDNFDLDAERRTINEEVTNASCLVELLESDDVEETKRRVCIELDNLTNPRATHTKVEVRIDCDEPFGMDADLVVINTVPREETDGEVIKRIKRREKEKVEREEKKRKREEKERQDYERLRKKFEGK